MCIFCEIVKGQIPAYKVYEDEDFFAFLDLGQATKGHTLIVPKKHYVNILDFNQQLGNKCFLSIQKVCEKLTKPLGTKDFNIVSNCGEKAGQTIMHFHIHIIPRYDDDGFNFVHQNNETSKLVLEALAKEINS